MIYSPEIENNPLKRRGHRFIERRERVLTLWNEGRYAEALAATQHKHAGTIFELFQQNPHPSWSQIAKTIGGSRTFAANEVSVLKDLGIPLGKK